MKKLYRYNSDEIYLVKTEYKDGNLAVLAYDIDDIPYGTVTVNIPGEAPEMFPDKVYAFIDTNNWPGVDQWLMANDIARPTGYTAKSGYCTYPMYMFKEDI